MAIVFTKRKIKEADADAFIYSADPPDPISALVQKIESLDKDVAIARVGELRELLEQTYFELGGVLCLVLKNKWYEPYMSFDTWAEKEAGLKRAKARSLVKIYDDLVSSGIPWAKIEHLGWTKVRPITSLLKGEEADHWIEMATAHSKAELEELVKEYKAQATDSDAQTTKCVALAYGGGEVLLSGKKGLSASRLKQGLDRLPLDELVTTITNALTARDKDDAEEALKLISKGVHNYWACEDA